MSPETRILTSDLRWVAAGDLSVGDGLLAFDEHLNPPKRRRMQFAEVVANVPRMAPVLAVELETGEILYATAEHPWLVSTKPGTGVKHRWRRTDQLLGEVRSIGHKGPPKGPVLLYKVFEPWVEEDTFDAGWLAGAYDGEGTIARHGANGTIQSQIIFNQNAGVVLDRAVTMLRDRGFPIDISAQRACHRLRINGGKQEKFRFLGQIRPVRLLEKWQTLDPGRLTQAASVRIISVTPAGEREVAGLQTTSGTYLAEGYAVHNCRFDLPVINSDLMRHDYPSLGAKKVQDTIRIRRTKGFKKGQDNLLTLLRVPEQKMALNWQQWQDAYEESDWATVIERVTSDVRGHKLLREEMLARGWLRAGRVWRP